MRQRNLRIASVLAAAIGMTVSFQNCGKAGFDGQEAYSSNLVNSDAADLKFAFDATFDQITYNSCFGPQTAGQSAFFTVMAGAYDGGGVKVTQEFLDHAKTSGFIKPVYPATTVTDEQIKLALAYSPANLEARPQMALRTRNKPQEVRTPKDNAGNPVRAVEGDYVTMLGDLTDDRWMDPLIRPKLANGTAAPEGTPSVFFNLAPGGQRNLEGAITYNNNEGLAAGLRTDLSSAGMLALTFKMRADLGLPESARPVDTADLNKVYGRGYNLSFSQVVAPYTALFGTGGAHGWNPVNTLTAVSEIDLKNPSKYSGTWSCDPNRRYLVVRKSDQMQSSALGRPYCPPDPYSYMINGIPNKMSADQYRREYEIARRHLKTEYWDISIEYRCAVPKSGECYTQDALNTGIEYDQRSPCYQGTTEAQAMYYNASGQYSPPVKRCAQYVSICNRN